MSKHNICVWLAGMAVATGLTIATIEIFSISGLYGFCVGAAFGLICLPIAGTFYKF